jgi:hypothetical protein
MTYLLIFVFYLVYIFITSDSSCFQVRGVPVGDVVLLESTVEVLPQSKVVSADFLCSYGFKRFCSVMFSFGCFPGV